MGLFRVETFRAKEDKKKFFTFSPSVLPKEPNAFKTDKIDDSKGMVLLSTGEASKKFGKGFAKKFGGF